MPNIGVPELLIVLVIAVLILGPKRIPAAARSVGEGIRGFRGSLKGDSHEESEAAKSEKTATIEKETKTGV